VCFHYNIKSLKECPGGGYNKNITNYWDKDRQIARQLGSYKPLSTSDLCFPVEPGQAAQECIQREVYISHFLQIKFCSCVFVMNPVFLNIIFKFGLNVCILSTCFKEAGYRIKYMYGIYTI